jgi:hypothetical protein
MPELIESPASTGADTSAASTTADTTGTPSSTSSGSTQTASKFSYEQDRSNWIPPHRLTEESSKRQQTEQRAQEYERQNQELQRRVQALAGVAPSADQQQADQQQGILAALVKVAPQLAPLLQMSEDQVQDFFSRVNNADSTNAHVWQNYGQQALGTIWGKLGELSGGDLDEASREDIREEFVNYLATDEQRRLRYEGGDPKILDEFVARVSRWVDRGRRLGSQTNVQRLSRPVPQGGRTAPVVQGTRTKVAPGDIDAAMDAAVKHLTERGVGFNG